MLIGKGKVRDNWNTDKTDENGSDKSVSIRFIRVLTSYTGITSTTLVPIGKP